MKAAPRPRLTQASTLCGGAAEADGPAGYREPAGYGVVAAGGAGGTADGAWGCGSGETAGVSMASSNGSDGIESTTPCVMLRDPRSPQRGHPTYLVRPRQQSEADAAAHRVRRGIRSWGLPPYLTEPAVRPPTMYFCRKRNSATTGSAAITAPAENALQSA